MSPTEPGVPEWIRDCPPFRTISDGLKTFRPRIDLESFIAAPSQARLEEEKPFVIKQIAEYGVAVMPTVLDGVTFVPNDWQKLLIALRIARTADGADAFIEGNRTEFPHWALDASMAATIGKGFRKIWRPVLSARNLRMADLPDRRARGWQDAYGSQFGKDPEPLDLSSLHIAVAPDRVDVLIDETGFAFEDAGGDLIVGPNAGHHIVNELIWKSELNIPAWMAERIDIIAPNSTNDFSRFGVSGDIVKRNSFRVTATGACAVHGGFDCSATLTISGSHHLFEGR